MARLVGASDEVPISAARFWSLDYLIFYAYYLICVGLFATFWFIYSPHRWQYWSILGTSLIIFVTWFLVEVGVAVNAWYAPFYDLIQTALSSPHKVTLGQFYHEVGVFLGIALIAVVIGVLNNFFVSHYVFRWRTAMNEHYMAHWQYLRHIEGAAQRVQEDTMRFASTLENMGVSFINAIMTLIAFLPVLVTLSAHVPNLPIVGHIPYGLVIEMTPAAPRRPPSVNCLARCAITTFVSTFTICISTSRAFSICRSITFSVCSCCFLPLLPVRLRWG